ncbi:MAG: carboxypeptidase regulatory-like domain-containing protein [Anaerolineae bacterium]
MLLFIAPVIHAQSGDAPVTIPGGAKLPGLPPTPTIPGLPPGVQVGEIAPGSPDVPPAPVLNGTVSLAVPGTVIQAGTGTISGTVYAPGGVTPVPNVFVIGYNDTYSTTWLCSDASGQYTLPAVPLDAPMHVEVWGYYDCFGQTLPYTHQYWQNQDYSELAGFVTATAATPNVSNVNFTMKQAGYISGTVYQPDGTTPLSGVTLLAYDYFSGYYATDISSDTDGTYTLHVPTGTYRIRMSDPDYATQYYDGHVVYADADPVAATVGATTPGIDFVAYVSGISGTVYLPDGVTSLANAYVYAADALTWDYAGSTYTDSGGHYQINVPPGTYHVVFYCEPYPYEYYDNHPNYQDADTIVVGTSVTSGIDAVIDAWGTINGYVFQPDGTTPEANAIVIASPINGDSSISVRTDANGFYQVLVRPGNYILEVQSQHYPREYYQDALYYNDADQISVVVDETISGINFTLDPGGIVTGDIIDADTLNPVQYAFVDFNGVFYSSTQSDGYGHYSIPLRPGTYTAQANRYPNYVSEFYDGATNYGDADPIVVTSGSTLTGINFSLDHAGIVTGTVYESDGVTPIYDALVIPFVEGYDGLYAACTNSSGNYTLGSLPLDVPIILHTSPGTCSDSMPVYIPEYWQEATDLASATPIILTDAVSVVTGINFTLDQGGTISGHVYQNDGVTPISDAVVIAEFDGYSGLYGVCADSNGHYSLGGLPLDTSIIVHTATNLCGDATIRYAVEFWQETPNVGSATPITLTDAASSVSGIDFTLDAFGSISGHVYESDGTTPVSGNVWVNIYNYATDQWITAASVQPDGSYSFSGLSGGEYRLNAVGDGYAFELYNNAVTREDSQAVTVVPGTAVTNIDFTLDPQGTITGTIYEVDGVTPLANMTINVQRGDTGYDVPLSTCSDASGQYTLMNVPLNVPLKITAARDDWNWCNNTSQIYDQEWWENTPDFNNATSIILTPGNRDAAGIDFSLDLGGTISGHVYESDGVTPVIGDAWVNLEGININAGGAGKCRCRRQLHYHRYFARHVPGTWAGQWLCGGIR